MAPWRPAPTLPLHRRLAGRSRELELFGDNGEPRRQRAGRDQERKGVITDRSALPPEVHQPKRGHRGRGARATRGRGQLQHVGWRPSAAAVAAADGTSTVLVELVGHPGSGKTDLAQGMEEFLQSAGTLATHRRRPPPRAGRAGFVAGLGGSGPRSDPRPQPPARLRSAPPSPCPCVMGAAVEPHFATAKKADLASRTMHRTPGLGWSTRAPSTTCAGAVITHADPDRPER